jgi:hypothetical protein
MRREAADALHLGTRTLNLGALTVTDGRLIIGDADFPPVGTMIAGVPNGRYSVEGATAPRDDGLEHIVSFSMRCGEGGVDSDVVNFAIDGGVVALADPAVRRPRSFLERWRLGRAVYKQQMRGLKRVPHELYFDMLTDSTGRPWAVIFYVGDGIYDVRVQRKDGVVTRLDCDLRSP